MLNGSGAKKVNVDLSNAVSEAIDKIGSDDLEKVRNEVVLSKKIEASRGDIKEAIAALSPEKRKRKRTQLTQFQAYKLMTWLDSQRDLIEKQKMSLAMVTDEFNKSVYAKEFKANPNNVSGACKELKITLSRRLVTNNQWTAMRHVLARLDRIEQGLGLPPMPKPEADQPA